MKFHFGLQPKRALRPTTKTVFRTGDMLVDPHGEHFVIGYRARKLNYLVLRPEGAPRDADNVRSLSLDEFETQHWTLFPREEVRTMARPSVPTPPKMTKAEWLKRTKTRVSLTKEELAYLAQLITAGRALLRDARSISPKLKAAMTRLGISTRGI